MSMFTHNGFDVRVTRKSAGAKYRFVAEVVPAGTKYVSGGIIDYRAAGSYCKVNGPVCTAMATKFPKSMAKTEDEVIVLIKNRIDSGHYSQVAKTPVEVQIANDEMQRKLDAGQAAYDADAPARDAHNKATWEANVAQTKAMLGDDAVSENNGVMSINMSAIWAKQKRSKL